MIIKNGGQTKTLAGSGKIKSIRVNSTAPSRLELWLNETSLSYLSIEEAIALRDELNQAVKLTLNL